LLVAEQLKEYRLPLGIENQMPSEDQIRDYHFKVEDNINKHGYHSTFVFSDKDSSFCYSTGIFESFGIPELFISSLPQKLSQSLIGRYVEKFKNDGLVSVDKKLFDLTDRFPVYLIKVPIDNLNDYALSSIRYYGGRNYEYLQLVYPDTRGRFPGDIGYDYDQVILGHFIESK
jgi:hypothetical protein